MKNLIVIITTLGKGEKVLASLFALVKEVVWTGFCLGYFGCMLDIELYDNQSLIDH